MKTIFLLVGVPAAGKSWVSERLSGKYEYVHHDLFIGMAGDAYVKAILERARGATKPLLGEAPFSVSQIKEPLERAGLKVVPVFIHADEKELHRRWDGRGNVSDSTRKGHLTRQQTYAERARALGAFRGSSSDVLSYLNRQ
jgi:adenylate kinase family enzyme